MSTPPAPAISEPTRRDVAHRDVKPDNAWLAAAWLAAAERDIDEPCDRTCVGCPDCSPEPEAA